MKKYFSYILKVATVFFMIIGFYNKVEADLTPPTSGSDVTGISNISITPIGPTVVEHWSEIGFTISFKVNQPGEEDVKPGDYIIVEWPTGDDLAAITPHDNQIELKDDSGTYFADATITHEGVIIVFRDPVSGHHSIEGSANIFGRVTKTNKTDGKTEKFQIIINKQVALEFSVEPAGSVITGTSDISKYGNYTGIEDYLTWNARINEDAEDTYTSDVKFVDNLQPGHDLVLEGVDVLDAPEPIFLLVYEKKNDNTFLTVGEFCETLLPDQQQKLKNIINGLTYTVGDNVLNYTYDEVKELLIAKAYSKGNTGVGYWVNDSGYFVCQMVDASEKALTINDYLGNNSFTANKASLSMIIPKEKINSKFLQLVYYSQVTADGQKLFNNNAELTYEKTDSTDSNYSDSVEVEYNTSSGDITGIAYDSIKVTKFNSNNKKLQGIYFEVTRKSDATYKEIIITDENGEAELDRLVNDEYYVKELTEAEAKAIDSDADYPDNILIDEEIHIVIIGTKKEETRDNDFSVINQIGDPLKGAFEIKKTVSGEAKSDKAYKVRITFTINDDLIKEEEISLKVNDPVIYTDLEEGTEITVTELESGYVTTYVIDNEATNKGTIVAGKIVKMTINNYKPPRKRRVPPTGI